MKKMRIGIIPDLTIHELIFYMLNSGDFHYPNMNNIGLVFPLSHVAL